jgi:hypothetical protein
MKKFKILLILSLLISVSLSNIFAGDNKESKSNKKKDEIIGKIKSQNTKYLRNKKLKGKGRIIGLAKKAPEFEIEVSRAGKKGTKTFSAKEFKDGDMFYEILLKKGTYNLKIISSGFKPIKIKGVRVKANYDIRIDLSFTYKKKRKT